MRFVSLNDVLWAIAEHVEHVQRAALGEQGDPAWLSRSYEADARYSDAASLLHQQLEVTNDPSSPRWLDYRPNTGRAVPCDTARKEGIAVLREQATWYWQWVQFRDKLHIRKMEAGCQVPSLNRGDRMIHAGGRWASPPSDDDYTRGCPPQPRSTSRYFQLVEQIGFEFADIVAFLDRRSILHTLASDGHGGVDSTVNPGDSALDEQRSELTDAPADVPVQLPDAGVRRTESAKASSGNRTARAGKVCQIENAILHAQDLAGSNRYDARAVYVELIKLARKCPGDFHPLHGYEAGQVVYMKAGRPTPYPYTEAALRQFLRRRLEALTPAG
jgi:hypothetical protein